MIMDNQNNHINKFINNQNYTETNYLTYLLGNDDTTDGIAQVKLSPYLDTQELCGKLYTVKSNKNCYSSFAYKSHGYPLNVAQKCLNFRTIRVNSVQTTEGFLLMFIMITTVNLLQ